MPPGDDGADLAAGYIARWRPSSVSPPAAAFARQVVPAACPGGRERAKNLLWAAARLADYAVPLGLDPAPEVLLHPSVIERFAAQRAGPVRRGAPHAAHQPAVHRPPGGAAAGTRGYAAAPGAGQGPLQPGGDRRVSRPGRRAAHRCRGGCARAGWSAWAPAPG